VNAEYFIAICGRTFTEWEQLEVKNGVLNKAYRWQYIVSDVQDPRFVKTLVSLIDETQSARIGAALIPILRHVDAH
jgi:hypothetical protein